MATFTAFCQDANGSGTIWIDNVEVDGTPLDVTTDEQIEAAKAAARAACASDWGYEDSSQIHVLGLAKGDVQIVEWEDIE